MWLNLPLAGNVLASFFSLVSPFTLIGVLMVLIFGALHLHGFLTNEAYYPELGTVVYHLLLSGGLYLLFWSRGFLEGRTRLVAALLLPSVLALLGSLPFWLRRNRIKRDQRAVTAKKHRETVRAEQERSRIYQNIRGGKKYAAFTAFLDQHRKQIYSVDNTGSIRYCDKLPIWVQNRKNGTWTVNPAVESQKAWKVKSCFTSAPDERAWTGEELRMIERVVGEEMRARGFRESGTAWTSPIPSDPVPTLKDPF